ASEAPPLASPLPRASREAPSPTPRPSWLLLLAPPCLPDRQGWNNHDVFRGRKRTNKRKISPVSFLGDGVGRCRKMDADVHSYGVGPTTLALYVLSGRARKKRGYASV
ncbi:unnamed protein product, partial [Ectocarpus sp. 12 AP-2014]